MRLQNAAQTIPRAIQSVKVPSGMPITRMSCSKAMDFMEKLDFFMGIGTTDLIYTIFNRENYTAHTTTCRFIVSV